MRALSKREAAPGLWMVDAEVPAIGRDEVLIRIRKTAICGSDMHIWHWDALAQAHVPVPMIVGHEYAGVIVEVGSGVQDLKVGDRVSGEGHLVCGRCKVCHSGEQHLCPHSQGVGSTWPGAFAEYLRLPARNAFKLPDDVDDDYGSILDPFGNAVHAALAFEVAARDVLVTGAGPIGIMAAAVAQHVGARRVVLTDVNPYKLDLASRMGLRHLVDTRHQRVADVMAEAGIEEGFDVGLEMSGAGPAFADQLTHLRPGGQLAVFGLSGQPTVPFPLNAAVIKGLTIKGIYGRRMFQTWRQMIALIQSGLDLRPVITHRMKADDFRAGFETMVSGQCGKVVLEWA